MNVQYEKSLHTLELPAVLEMLAAQAVSETAKQNCLNLRPVSEKGMVRRRLAETSAAKQMMVLKGSPSFYGIKDVRHSLSRADLGGMLNTTELLALNIYSTYNISKNYHGVAQAKAVVFFLLVAVLALAQQYATRSKEVQQ